MIRPVPDRIELRLPNPCLVVLIGAAGSGKSTLAARHFAPGDVLSSDTLRERIAGDAADQRATGAAFAALHRALTHRLAQRQLAVVDATSASARERRPLLAAARGVGIPAIAIVLDLPAALVLARNADRPGRSVPEDAVRRHLNRLAASLRPPGLEAEGFARVLVLRDQGEVDALVVVRGPAAPAEHR